MRFAVHWPGYPVASPRSHGVPRRDVPGRVHVSVAGKTAGYATEDGLALARLRISVPARRAALAREMRLDFLDPSRSLVLQSAHQKTPSGSEDFPVQASFSPYIAAGLLRSSLSRADHARDVQILNADHIELASQPGARFLRPVFAPVRFSDVQPGDRVLHSRTSIRAAFRPGQLPLQAKQALTFLTDQDGNVEPFPVDSAADTATPRSTPTTSPLPGAGMGSGIAANAMCHRPARSKVTR